MGKLRFEGDDDGKPTHQKVRLTEAIMVTNVVVNYIPKKEALYKMAMVV